MKTKRKKEEIKNKKQKTKKNGGNDKVNIVKSGTIKFTGDFKKYFENYQSMIANSEKLEQHYDNFWNNVYYNDTYLFYKYAIQYYQNICNGKPCVGFTRTINEKLITGNCDFTDELMRKKFINQKNANIDKIDLDDLCEFTTQIINNLDRVFQICPKLPFAINVYRDEIRKINDPLLQIKKGDYYRNKNYMSSTINASYRSMNEMEIGLNVINYRKDELDKMDVRMEIILPQNTMAYYINYPFNVRPIYDDRDKIITHGGWHEFEILLPRDNIFEIIETKTIDDVFFITMELKLQFKPLNNSIKSKKTMYIYPDIISKKEFQEYAEHSMYINYESSKNKLDIDLQYLQYKETSDKIKRKRNGKFFDDFYSNSSRIYDILDIPTKYLLEWENKKPTQNKKKYPQFTQNVLDDIYKTYLVLTGYKKQKTNTIYTYFWRIDGENLLGLYDKIKKLDASNDANKIIDFKYPFVFYKKLTASFFADIQQFSCKTEGKKERKYDNYYYLDHSFPPIIVIKYTGDVSYYPTQIYDGITFDVQEMQIKKVNKIQLATQTFFYLVEATKTDEVNVAK
jgi:hypothetical protein